ncbi:MAG: T9SS type A sorting domain-containing protein [Chitinophagaceae bacterium]|nr:T9SS type A sorting domain-containing protein [Chitinophagaceae bacterium]
MAGRIMSTQQNNATQGINSISINHLERLLPGMYLLQMNDGKSIQTTKFTIAR